MRDARYSVAEDCFIVTFESGKEYRCPRSSLEVDDGTAVVSVHVKRRRFYFRVIQGSGNRYEVPWDRVYHEAEPACGHFRGNSARAITTHNAGAAIRKLREAKGLTQDQLETAVGMMRGNISRIEAAKHRPTLETLEKNRESAQGFGGGLGCTAPIVARSGINKGEGLRFAAIIEIGKISMSDPHSHHR
jgi:DNA-binding XRE family transcriptional regulator